MCMEDIRIMRRTSARELTTPVGTTPVVIVPQDRYIVAVKVSNNGPNNVTVSMLPGIVAGQGILELAAFQEQTWTLVESGAAITHGLFAVCAAAQLAQVTVWITYLNED